MRTSGSGWVEGNLHAGFIFSFQTAIGGTITAGGHLSPASASFRVAFSAFSAVWTVQVVKSASQPGAGAEKVWGLLSFDGKQDEARLRSIEE